MEASRFQMPLLASTYGNLCAEPGEVTFAGEAAGQAVDIIKLPPGAELIDLIGRNDALGVGVTLSFGLRYESADDGTDDPDALKAAAAADAAGRIEASFHPTRFDVPVIVTMTTGGAAATGKVSITPVYRYMGTK